MIRAEPSQRPIARPSLVRLSPPTSRPVDHAVALPAEVVRALRRVAAELRNMPRDCARDREELVLWHGRLARRLEDVLASKARFPIAAPTCAVLPPALSVPPTSEPARSDASAPAGNGEATLAAQPRPCGGGRWRARPIDAAFRRRAEAAGQLGLLL